MPRGSWATPIPIPSASPFLLENSKRSLLSPPAIAIISTLGPRPARLYPCRPRTTSFLQKKCGVVSAQGHRSGDSVESDEGGRGEKGNEVKLRVCTNRTCRKSGSLQILELLQGIAPSNVKVEACGCLGYCGSGPNIAVLPAMIIVKYCSTPAHAARLLAIQCGVFDPDVLLQAYTLKQQGVTAFENGELEKAEQLISQAINMRPSGGLHVLHTTRSSIQLALGEGRAALYDAEIATSIAPKWPTALIQKGDAYKSLGDFEAAENAYKRALALDPSLRRSKSFQTKVKELQSRLMPIEVSPNYER